MKEPLLVYRFHPGACGVPLSDAPVIVEAPSLSPSPDLTAPPRATPGWLARDATWVVLGRVAGIGGTALLAFLLPRLLSRDEYGIFMVWQSWLGLGAVVAVVGLPLGIVKLLGEARAHHDRVKAANSLKIALRFLLVTSLVVTFGASVLLWFFPPTASGSGSSIWLVAPYAVSLLAIAWLWVLVEALRGLGEVRLASLFAGGQSGGACATLLFATGMIAWTAWQPPTASTALQLFGASVAGMVLIAAWILRRTWFGLSQTMTVDINATSAATPVTPRVIFALCLPICASQLLAYATLAADIPIAGLFSSSGSGSIDNADIALLGQSRRLLMVLQLPAQLAVMTLLPTLAHLAAQHDYVGLQRVVRRATTISFIAAIPAATVLLIAPGYVMATLFGKEYAAGAPLLMLFTIAQLVAAHNGMAGHVLIMAGKQRAVMFANGATALLMIPLGICGAWLGGITGLAMASAAVLAVQSTAEWWLARRLLGVWTQLGPWPWQRGKSAAEEQK